jgi:hypothetical protein
MKDPQAEDDADKDEHKGDDGEGDMKKQEGSEAAAESPQILAHSHEVDGDKWVELQYGPADTTAA